MSEGTPENKVTYFTAQGHSHDGINSTKIDFSGYDLFDFITEGDLKRIVLNIVDDNPLRPKGGIIIEPPEGGADGVFIGPTVPGTLTGLASTCEIVDDGASIRNVTWNKVPGASSYIVQLYRSIDDGANYLKVAEVETSITSHSFEQVPMANVADTKYKLIAYGKSGAGISGGNQIISNISACVDTTAPSGPKFEDSSSSSTPNMFVSFKGFIARLQEQTEADTKWGIGQFEYSVSTSLASEGQWVSNEVKSGRQTGRIITASGLTTGTAYYLRVRAYDNSNNYSPWTYWNGLGDDGDATMSNADSITPARITGNADIVANSITASEIAAHTITAGEIQANTISADRLQTTFALVDHTIQSNSYTAGDEGWMIQYDGTAEFNGAVTARNLTIVGKTSDSNDCSIELQASNGDPLFKVDPNGDVTAKADLTVGNWTSSSGKGMNWDSSAGELSIRGVIGIVGGWTIDASAMYVGSRTTSGYSSSGITFYSGGSLHSKNFYIDSSGEAHFSTSGSGTGAKLVISPTASSVAEHSWIQGYTGSGNEAYPGLLIFTTDSSTESAVYLAAPRFTTTTNFSGFKAVHNTAGRGFVTMGTPDKQNTFISTSTSASAVTNVLGYGGLSFAEHGDPGAGVGNTLYRKNTNELWWNDSRIDGGSTYTFSSPLSESGGTVSIDLTSYMTHWKVQGDDASPTDIGPTQETLTISGGTHLTSARASNQITINHNSGAGSNHIPAGGSSGQVLEYGGSSGTAQWASASGGVTDHGALSGLSDDDHPQYLKLTGGTMSGGITFSNGNHITGSSSSNVYFQGGSSGTSWLRAYSGSSAKIKCGSAGDIVFYASPRPNGNMYHDLGTSSLWWNYSYHYKMDTSALPGAAGSGWYMWFNTSDQVMKTSSSERIKKDIVTIPTTEALDRIKDLRPVEFSAKTNPSDLVIDDMWEFKRYRGFIAEEAATVDKDYGLYNWWKSNDPDSEDYDKVLPSLSSLQREWTDEEVAAYYDLDEARPQMFDLHAILADSVGAIQELSNKLEAAEARLAALEA